MADTCEYESCPMPAEGWIDATWSSADFLRYDLCHDHLWAAFDDLSTRKVEGSWARCEVHYYDPISWMP